MKRRFVSFVLLAAVLCCMLPSVSAAGNYVGVKDWFRSSLQEMEQLELLPSSFEGKDLSKNITRGEMCELAVHALEAIVGYHIVPERTDYFSDTSTDYIIKAYELGIVSGYEDGTFRPEKNLTRQEFFKIVENFCNAAAFLPTADGTYLTSFSDSASVAGWAREAAQICVKYGYVNGRPEGSQSYLVPTGYATCQEAMAMFLRAYKSLNEYYYYIKNASVVIDTPSDPLQTIPENTVIDDVHITGTSKYMLVDTANLNVRSNWSVNGTILGTVSRGTELTVTGLCDNGWIRIDYHGQTGYVSGDFLINMPETSAPETVTPEPDPHFDSGSVSGTAVDIANFAMQFVGYPYVYGAEHPDYGFDCSGLVYYSFSQFGYSLKRVADDQMEFNGTPVSRDQLQVGDLVFFGHGTYANHVGIYIGGNNFVHAANPSSGVRVSSLNETYYASRYLTAKRIITN